MKSEVKSKSFAQNVVKLASGTLLAQLITIALMPVITRIYSTDSYGEFSIIIAIAMTITPVSCLRYNAAIVLAHDNEESKALVCLSLGINLGIVVLLVFIASGFSEEISQLMGLSSELLVWFIPVVVLINGWRIIVEAWGTRHSMFTGLAISSVTAAAVDRSAGIVIGLLNLFNGMGLLFARVLGTVASVFVLLANRSGATSTLSISCIRKMLHRYRSFAVYSFSALILQLSVQAPIYLLGIMYTPSAAGLYAISARVLAEPIQVLGVALGRSFLQRASEVNRTGGNVSSVTLKLFDYLLKTILVPISLFTVLAPSVFGFIFGAEWQESGVYVRYLAPMFILAFVVRPLGALFDVLEKQKEQMIMNVVMLISTLCVFGIGMLGVQVDIVLLLFSISMSFIISFRIFWLLRQVGVERSMIKSVVVKNIKSFIVFVVPVIILSNLSLTPKVAIFAAVLVSLIIYSATTVSQDPRLKASALKLLNWKKT